MAALVLQGVDGTLVVMSASAAVPGYLSAVAAVAWATAAIQRLGTSRRAWAAGLHDSPPAMTERLPFMLGWAVAMVALSRPQLELRIGAAIAITLMAVRATEAVRVRRGLIGERDRLLVVDHLTGAHNRRFLAEEAPRALGRATRSGRPLSLIAFDLDRFKQVNDTLGHDVGDRLLTAVTESVTGQLRVGDLLFRLGGDEFLVLCPDTDGPGAEVLANRLRGSVAESARPIARGIDVTGSFGVAAHPSSGGDLPELLRRADEALYAAKVAGRDAVRRWEQTLPAVGGVPSIPRSSPMRGARSEAAAPSGTAVT